MKNSGLFLNMAKGCFLFVSFFQALMSLCFLSGKLARVLKCLFSPVLGLCGVASSCLFGFGRFRCFGVSCFVSLFWCWFCFCVFALFCFVVGCCCFCFLVFSFFGGLKGQVRWPEGPPHLALNPPCFLFLFFLLKGSGEVAQRATSLGPKPSFYFFVFLFVFCFCFPYFVLKRKTLFLPLRKAIFVYFSVFPFVSLWPFWGLPFFPFRFLCLSLSLLFFSFFLPSCFSLLFLVLAFSFCFVCFLVQDVILFLFFCLLSCFVLNHHV